MRLHDRDVADDRCRAIENMLYRAEGSGRVAFREADHRAGIMYLARVGPFVIERRGLGRASLRRRGRPASSRSPGSASAPRTSSVRPASGPGSARPCALRSGVDRSAGPAVEAQRLHDRERRGGGRSRCPRRPARRCTLRRRARPRPVAVSRWASPGRSGPGPRADRGTGAKWVRTLAGLTRHRASALTGP